MLSAIDVWKCIILIVVPTFIVGCLLGFNFVWQRLDKDHMMIFQIMKQNKHKNELWPRMLLLFFKNCCYDLKNRINVKNLRKPFFWTFNIWNRLGIFNLWNYSLMKRNISSRFQYKFSYHKYLNHFLLVKGCHIHSHLLQLGYFVRFSFLCYA